MDDPSPSKQSARGDEEPEDPNVCGMCLDGTVYENNEILFCDKCNVPVHQTCYGVTVIPEGPWFCQVCAVGGDPQTTTCELCSNVGGAYKQVLGPGHRWAHGLCATWIPEIYSVDVKGITALNFSHLDKKRYKLKCSLCSTKGACIQCSYGRCTSSAHPWCVLFNPKGCTNRIVKDENGDPLWEVFCKTHAHAVTEPVKPKPKAKSQSLQPNLDESCDVSGLDINRDSKALGRGYGGSSSSSTAALQQAQPQALSQPLPSADGSYVAYYVAPPSMFSHQRRISMAHALRFQQSAYTTKTNDGDDEDDNNDSDSSDSDSDGDSEAGIARRNKRRGRRSSAGGNRNNGAAGKGKSVQLKSGKQSGSALTTTNPKKKFPIHTLSEWPGMSEGEGMDLDHFWNVVSMSYPEDHSEEWAKFMTAPYLPADDGTSPYYDPTLMEMPPAGDAKAMRELSDSTESKYEAFVGERERQALLDLDKRNNFLTTVYSNIALLAGVSLEDLARRDVMEAVLTGANAFDDALLHQPRTNESLDDELMFLVSNKEEPFEDDASSKMVPKNESLLSVVFDGVARLACDLKVVPKQQLSPKKSITVDNDENENVAADVGIEQTVESAMEEAELKAMEEARQWVVRNLVTSAVSTSEDLSTAEIDEYVQRWSLSLVGKPKTVSTSNEVHLRDKVIIPQDEDDILSRIIRSDQAAYKTLGDAITNKLRAMVHDQILPRADQIPPLHRTYYNNTDQLYTKQRVWRQVALNMYKGMRDQGSDFNKHEDESIPASWTIKVNGRNPAAVAAAEDETPADDAICMCCFDGSSTDHNCILFCDGCNVALHQACYGVSEVPEGDFFCDRCQHIRSLADSLRISSNAITGSVGYNVHHIEQLLGDTRHQVMCCLCPVQHGGIKPTTDGRWVHVCCAVWSQDAVILDLTEMRPVDVSAVPCQVPREDDPAVVMNAAGYGKRANYTAVEIPAAPSAPPLFTHPNNPRNIETACMFCQAYGGYVVKCCGDPESGNDCIAVFHPLCAWFQGAYIETDIKDPSFQGTDRGGIYPSGLAFKFCCGIHTPVNKRDRLEQFQLRGKYRLNEEDLDGIPGRSRRRKKKNAKPFTATTVMVPQNAMKIVRVAGGAAKPTDLSMDVYKENMCSVCLAPVDSVMSPEDHEAVDAMINTNSGGGVDVVSGVYKRSCTQCGMCAHDRCLREIGMGVPPTTVCVTAASDAPLSSSSSATGEGVVVPDSSITPPGVDDNHSSSFDVPKINSNSNSNVNGTQQQCVSWQCGACRHGRPQHQLQQQQQQDPATGSGTAAQADPNELRCVLCPRRGGFFMPTTDQEWVHPFCARFCPGGIRLLLEGGLVDIRNIPKENKKQKCVICNRKTGVCVGCNFVGCTTYFHALCAERIGRGFLRTRAGFNECYCVEHIPEGIEKIPSTGFSVDVYEVQRLRYTLDRSRLIFDTIIRRERFKRNLSKAEGECFTDKANRLLDKALGRKTKGGAASDMQWDDSDGSYGSSDDGADADDNVDDENKNKLKPLKKGRGRGKAHTGMENWIPLAEYYKMYHLEPPIIPLKADAPLPLSSSDAEPVKAVEEDGIEEPQLAEDEHENESPYPINSTWNQLLEKYTAATAAASAKSSHLNRIYKPQHSNNNVFQVSFAVAGVEVSRADSALAGATKNGYTKAMRDRVTTAVDGTRHVTQLFSTGREFNDFVKKLAPSVIKQVSLPLAQFKAEMKAAGIVHNDISFSSRRAQQQQPQQVVDVGTDSGTSGGGVQKKIKRGYVVVEEEELLKPPTQAFPGDLVLDGKRSRHSRFEHEPTTVINTVSHGKRSKVDIDAVANHSSDGEYRHAGKNSSVKKKVEQKVANATPSAASAAVGSQSTGRGRKRKDQDQAYSDDESFSELLSTFTKRQLLLKEKEKEKEKENEKEKEKPTKKVNTTAAATPVVHKTMGPILTDPKDLATRIIPIGSERLSEAQREAQQAASGEHQGKIPLLSAMQGEPFAAALLTSYKDGLLSKIECYDSLFEFFGEFLVDSTSANSDPSIGSSSSSSSGVRGRRSVGASGTTTEADTAEDEWIVHNEDDTLPQLERRIQEILNTIEAFEVEDEAVIAALANPKSSSSSSAAPSSVSNLLNSKSKQKRGRRKKAKDEYRLLVEEFMEIPESFLPEYQVYVRRVVTIETMKEKLKHHRYRFMGAFSKDFYTMLNNARSITPDFDPLWSDTIALAKIFEEAKAKSVGTAGTSAHALRLSLPLLSSDAAAAPNTTSSDVVYREKIGAPKPSSKTTSTIEITCCECKQQYFVENWPIDMVLTHTEDTKNAALVPGEHAKAAYFRNWVTESRVLEGLISQRYQAPPPLLGKSTAAERKTFDAIYRNEWVRLMRERYPMTSICANCVGSLKEALVGRCVQIWWHDDECKYTGHLNAYDPVSGKHRVLYDDGEWEFIDLKKEPVWISTPCVLPMSPRAAARLHRNIN